MWREAAKREGDRGEGQGRELRGGGGLSAFDVKSLRQKHSGAECCSTCTGNPRCQRQHGDGEDEGEKKKNRREGAKMRKSQET